MCVSDELWSATGLNVITGANRSWFLRSLFNTQQRVGVWNRKERLFWSTLWICQDCLSVSRTSRFVIHSHSYSLFVPPGRRSTGVRWKCQVFSWDSVKTHQVIEMLETLLLCFIRMANLDQHRSYLQRNGRHFWKKEKSQMRIILKHIYMTECFSGYLFI